MLIPAPDLAAVTAKSCFEKADTDKDGQLSFEEFQAWFSGSEVEQLGSMARASCESPPPPHTVGAVVWCCPRVSARQA